MKITWDEWRARYATLTDSEQKTFHDAVYAAYPVQKHYWLKGVQDALIEWKSRDIVEIGGWVGHLASEVLETNKEISSWLNIELCGAALRNNVCKDERYSIKEVDSFRWWEKGEKLKADTVVATHFIEHLSDKDFLALGKYLKDCEINHIYFEAPLSQHGKNYWNGTATTHMLEMNWCEVNHAMRELGYETVDGVKYWKKGE